MLATAVITRFDDCVERVETVRRWYHKTTDVRGPLALPVSSKPDCVLGLSHFRADGRREKIRTGRASGTQQHVGSQCHTAVERVGF